MNLRDTCRRLDRQLLPLCCYLVPAANGWKDSNGEEMPPPPGSHQMHLLRLVNDAIGHLNEVRKELEGPNA